MFFTEASWTIPCRQWNVLEKKSVNTMLVGAMATNVNRPSAAMVLIICINILIFSHSHMISNMRMFLSSFRVNLNNLCNLLRVKSSCLCHSGRLKFNSMEESYHRLVQERRNSIALAMELRLFCTNPSISHVNNYVPNNSVQQGLNGKCGIQQASLNIETSSWSNGVPQGPL